MPEHQAHRDGVFLTGCDLLEQIAIARAVFGPFTTDKHHARVKSPGDDVHAMLCLKQVVVDALEHFFAADERLEMAVMARQVNLLACPDPPGQGQALVGA
jgi:hypothetical protein